MALDGPQGDDEVFDDDGITYVIDRQLFERVKPIRVDFVTTYMGSGFSISANMPNASSRGGSCSC
jgi:Fe-S cluster assembly iron-binding protein IscA